MQRQIEEWAGYLRLGLRTEFIKFNGSIVSTGQVTLDVPNQRTFGIPLSAWNVEWDAVVCTVTLAGEALTLSGTVDGENFAGRVHGGGSAGWFEVRRVAIWETSRYRALSGAYRLAGGREISVFVNADSWLETPVLFYSEGNAFVRLHPDAKGCLISESLERFRLDDSGHELSEFRPRAWDEDGPASEVSRRIAWHDEPVRISGPDGQLSGTLMKPPGGGPHAAVVLIHESAGGQRDVYKAFGEHFVQAGLAALVYDRRGHGESTGDPRPSFEEKSLDAEAWVDYLQSRSDICADRVGVWGLSNGSWVAPMVAARRPDVAFVVVIGASGTIAVETEIHRRTFELREHGLPGEQIEQVAETWRLVYDYLLSGRPDPGAAMRWDQLMAALRGSEQVARLPVQSYAVQDPFLGPLPPYATYQEMVDDSHNHLETDEWTCDPVDSYRAIDVPVLFLVGDSDSNLPPLLSARRVSKVLHDAGNHAAAVLVFPNAGHLLNHVQLGTDVGLPSEEIGYRFHHFRFADGLLEIVRAWAAARATG